MDDIIHRLKESPPDVLVVGVNQRKKFHSSRADDPFDYHDFGAWVAENYEPIGGADRNDILLLRP